MTQTQAASKDTDWTMEKQSYKNGEDNLIVAIDDSIRRLKNGKHKAHLKKRSITQSLTLLIKALEAYDQHGTPMPHRSTHSGLISNWYQQYGLMTIPGTPGTSWNAYKEQHQMEKP